MPEFEEQPANPHPHHGQGHHRKDVPTPVDKPEDEKTAGDLRAEDAAADTENVTAQKQGDPAEDRD